MAKKKADEESVDYEEPQDAAPEEDTEEEPEGPEYEADEEPTRAEIIAPLEGNRGEGVEGEPSELMTVTPDEREKLEAMGETEAPVAGEDYPIGNLPIILPGFWVRLADTEKVRSFDERVVGHVAHVTDALVVREAPSLENPGGAEYQPEEAEFEVRTRDEFGMILTGLTREDFSEVGGDRVSVMAHG